MSSQTSTFGKRDGSRSRYRPLIASLLDYGTRVKDAILFTQLDIAAMGVAGVLTVMFVTSLPLSPAPVVIALVTYGVYVGDRLGDVKREPEATSDRVAFMKRHKTVLSVTSAGAYGLAIAVAAFGGPLTLAITLLPGVAWILYASEWGDSVGASMSRLKQIVGVNSAVVALAWAVAIVFIPLSFAGASLTPITAVLFAYFFCDIYINAEIPNFRDMEDDAANGVETLPLLFGVDRTRQIIYSINLFIVAILVASYAFQLLSLVILGAALVGRVYALVVHRFVGRTDDYRLLELLGEMKHVLVGALLFGWLLH